MSDLISRRDAIEYFMINTNWYDEEGDRIEDDEEKRKLLSDYFNGVPSAEPEIIRCKYCKHWERQTWKGVPLSWGHCESEIMWDSIDGETYEVAHINTNEEHFCGYAERKNNV